MSRAVQRQPLASAGWLAVASAGWLAVAAAGWQSANAAVITGALTWLIRTGRRDLA